MITVEEALSRCFALLSPLPVETVPLRQALGRVLSAPAIARLTQPPFDASAMDGYALGSVLAAGARYRVIGEAGAGHGFAGQLGPDEATRIFTGAPLPKGAQTIAIQEDVVASGTEITVTTAPRPGDNIRKRGQDFAKGDSLSAPRRLRANDLALLASMNIADVAVARRPVVAIIATGDELVMPGEDPGPDQIVASNLFALEALARAEGADVRLLPIARDSEDELRQVFELAALRSGIMTLSAKWPLIWGWSGRFGKSPCDRVNR